MMSPNEKYWSDFYSSSEEVPLQPSNFALYAIRFLENLPARTSQMRILDLGCGNGRDSYFFSSKGYKVTAVDPFAKIITDQFRFVQKNFFDLELKPFDVYYLRFVIHTLTESDCNKLFEKLSVLPPEVLIMFETRSTTGITTEEKMETFFSSPIGNEHFRMLYSKRYVDKKISKIFNVMESSDSSNVAVFKSENPFCLRYIISPKS
jgi:SAM-dependent methyltransferase